MLIRDSNGPRGPSVDASPRDINRFTTGDCHILARAIQKRTGWPIHCFVVGGYADTHAFVLTPDGRALDVQGVCTVATLRRRYKNARGCRHKAFEWKTLRREWDGPMFGDHSYRRARELAPLLVAAAKGAEADTDYRLALAEALEEKIPLREVARAAGTAHSNVHRIIHGRSR